MSKQANTLFNIPYTFAVVFLVLESYFSLATAPYITSATSELVIENQ